MRRTNDDRFDAAWQAFAAEDEQTMAPPGLERRVIDATRAALDRRARLRRRIRVLSAISIGAAAAALLVAVAGPRLLPVRVIDVPVAISAPRPAYDTATTAPARPDRTLPLPDPPRPLAARRAPSPVPDALMTLTAEPILETESLQLVRVRMPRAALSAFGVALSEPDSSGVVDVDVLVGDDGLPRDIRRIQPVPNSGRK